MYTNILRYSLLLSLALFTGCRPYRNSTEYIVRTQLVKHTPNTLSAFKYQVLLKKWSRSYQSYLEVGQYETDGKSVILFSSDDFKNYNRYNVLTGFYRQHTTQNQESIRYTELDSTACAKFVEFQKELKTSGFEPIKKHYTHYAANFDYAFSEDTFIRLRFFRPNRADMRSSKLKISQKADLWVKGRKHSIQLKELNQAIADRGSFYDHYKQKPEETKAVIGFPRGKN